jgi:hypothetical protein
MRSNFITLKIHPRRASVMLTKSFERDLLSYLSPDAYWAASVKLQVRKQTPEEPPSEEDEKHAVSDSQMPTFGSNRPGPAMP